jgi:beta-1,3-N-acetylgalactosaminyltransferase 2
VERFGKWREPDYSASVYPAFACGAGNMLSADLVKWLARNVDDLKEYQV